MRINKALASLLAVAVIFALGTASPVQAQNQDGGASPSQSYEVDSVHSSVVFSAKHFGAEWVYGIIPGVSGNFTVNWQDPTQSSISLTIDATTLFTGSEQRDNHLKNPDFLNTKQFPEITFESTSVEKTGTSTFEVTGDLTLHGQTNEETFEVVYTGEGTSPDGTTRTGWHASFSITRSDYGMNFGLDSDPEPASDQIDLIISVAGMEQ